MMRTIIILAAIVTAVAASGCEKKSQAPTKPTETGPSAATSSTASQPTASTPAPGGK